MYVAVRGVDSRDMTIYDKCPVYSSDHFLLRSVEQRDAKELLGCYSDPLSVRLINADNCTSDFNYQTLDEMNDCIRGWLSGYRQGVIVRFSVIDNQNGKAIGTIEMYRKKKDIGILRLDLCSAYETQKSVRELLELSVENFYNEFCVKQILTKAIPLATERISALSTCGFTPVEQHAMSPYGDYYMHIRH